MTASTDAAFLAAGELVPVADVTTERRNLTREEAQLLTDEIRRTSNRLWVLVATAYERKAYKALGYSDWKSYVTAELQLSEAQSYNLVDVGKVMVAVGEAAGVDPTTLDPIPIRAVRRVKGNLAGLKRAIAHGLAEGYQLTDVVPMALKEVAPTPSGAPADKAAPAEDYFECPVCMGSGRLTGKGAEDLWVRATNWLKRYVQ